MLGIVRIGSLFLVTALTQVCVAKDDQPNDALKHAQALSSLTGPHAQPFHLRLTVSEPANPNSPYRAMIEEFWKSSTDWQRTIDSPGFRQNLTVKGDSRNEQNSGGYYPIWLRSFVTAAIDPLEDAAFWNQVSARIVLTTTTNGKLSTSCARAQFKIGAPPLNNDAFAVICFNSDGTLSSVVRPGYDMEFHDAQVFGKKRIAYRYVDDPEPGKNLVGTVEVLEQIKDGASIPIVTSLADQSSELIKSFPINQVTFDQLASGQPALVWPPVHSGNTSGKLSMFVSVDKDGRVREAYPLNSDNAGLQDAARDQLLKWQLKPAVVDGKRTQVEAALTFAFSTTLEGVADSSGSVVPSAPVSVAGAKPIVVSPAIANSLRVKSYAPVYPQALREHRVSGKVDLKAVIGSNGQIVSLTPILSNNPGFTTAAITAVQHWAYKPYLLNGEPVEFETVITLNFQAP
jgi:Gram-negative bacterial TonB protein C-terminal